MRGYRDPPLPRSRCLGPRTTSVPTVPRVLREAEVHERSEEPGQGPTAEIQCPELSQECLEILNALPCAPKGCVGSLASPRSSPSGNAVDP